MKIFRVVLLKKIIIKILVGNITNIRNIPVLRTCVIYIMLEVSTDPCLDKLRGRVNPVQNDPAKMYYFKMFIAGHYNSIA